VRKSHLNLLALAARLFEGFCIGQGADTMPLPTPLLPSAILVFFESCGGLLLENSRCLVLKRSTSTTQLTQLKKRPALMRASIFWTYSVLFRRVAA
jgi:hypothetical protein